MRRSIPILTAAALVALAGCGTTVHSAALTSATAAATTGTLTTNGVGSASVTPDVMTVEIGVSNTAAHVAAALKANNTVSAAVQTALMRNGVSKADIQTVQLSVYASSRKGVTTYHVSDVVSAALHNLKTAGTVLDLAIAAAGSDGRLDGASFSVNNLAGSLARARARAVADAHTDADQLAAAGGLTVVGLRSITDHTDPYQNYPEGIAASGSSGAGGTVPLQPGTQQTTVQVTAVWTVRG